MPSRLAEGGLTVRNLHALVQQDLNSGEGSRWSDSQEQT